MNTNKPRPNRGYFGAELTTIVVLALISFIAATASVGVFAALALSWVSP